MWCVSFLHKFADAPHALPLGFLFLSSLAPDLVVDGFFLFRHRFFFPFPIFWFGLVAGYAFRRHSRGLWFILNRLQSCGLALQRLIRAEA